MKKTILVALMVALITTPCFAQEVESDGLFSIEGTEWEALPMGVQIFPFRFIRPEPFEFSIGFYDGKVYPDLRPDDSYFYIDMPLFSVFSIRNSILTHQGGVGSLPSYSGILKPNGIGMVVKTVYNAGPRLYNFISIALLNKTDDSWSPPEIGSISPSQGEQGTILTDVTITGVNTYFESGVDDITFSPTEGITISNVSPISNTEIDFDLTIAAGAPLGIRDVRVWYDDRGKFILGDQVFEVLEKPF